MNGAELAEAIADSVNSGINSQEYREKLRAEHAYLQQEAYDSVIKESIVVLASAEMVDRRNRRAVEEAREIADYMGWAY